MAIVLGLIWTFVMETPQAPFYGFGVAAFATCSVIEMMTEPLIIVAQELLYLKLKASLFLHCFYILFNEGNLILGFGEVR